jgi:hypothetical protein
MVLLFGPLLFQVLGGPAAIARAEIRHHLRGTVDAPDLRATPWRVDLRNGRLREEGHGSHVILRVQRGEASVQPHLLRVPWILLEGNELRFRERIDTGFVRDLDGDHFPRFEFRETRVTLGGREILRVDWAELTRSEDRVYAFRGKGLRHRNVDVDEVRLRLLEHDGGVDVPGAVVRLLGGEATGSAEVGADGSVRGRLKLEGLDLATISLLLGSPSRTRFAGRLSGRLEGHGDPHRLEDLEAEGSVRVRDLAIHDEPLLLEILGLLHAVPSEESPFDRGSARFRLEGAVLHLMEAEVLGSRWGLRGEGTIDLETRDVDLEVVLVSRGSGLTLPIVGDRLRQVNDALRQRVARARVKGTLAGVTVVPTALEELRGRMVEFVGRVVNYR